MTRLIWLTQTTVCETTLGVRAFSGYINFPASTISDLEPSVEPYNYSTFFYYYGENLVNHCLGREISSFKLTIIIHQRPVTIQRMLLLVSTFPEALVIAA